MLWVHTAPSVSEFTLDSRELTEEVNTIDLSLTSAGGLAADTRVEIGERAMLVRCDVDMVLKGMSLLLHKSSL